MPESPPQHYDTLSEAYGAVYRCPVAEFEGRVFWKCLFAHAWLPAKWIWWTEREFFRPDLEAIRALGAARCEADLQRAIDDLENQGLVERSIRRGRLLIRLSTARLITLLCPLLPLLKPILVEAEEYHPIPTTTEATQANPARPARTHHAARRSERIQGGVQMVRILKRLHNEIVTGRTLESALSDAGLSRAEAEAALADFSTGRPELEWLRGYLLVLDELEAWRAAPQPRNPA